MNYKPSLERVFASTFRFCLFDQLHRLPAIKLPFLATPLTTRARERARSSMPAYTERASWLSVRR